MPPVLRGREVRFQFESPLQAANDRAKAESYVQAAQLLAMTTPHDPTVKHDINLDLAFRDALMASGVPATWVRDEKEAAMAKDAEAQQMQMQQAMAQLGQGAEVAGAVGGAAQELQAGNII
jgi:hypothetical protein